MNFRRGMPLGGSALKIKNNKGEQYEEKIIYGTFRGDRRRGIGRLARLLRETQLRHRQRIIISLWGIVIFTLQAET